MIYGDRRPEGVTESVILVIAYAILRTLQPVGADIMDQSLESKAGDGLAGFEGDRPDGFEKPILG